MCGVLVSVKSFQKFLNSHVISTTTIACKSTIRHEPLPSGSYMQLKLKLYFIQQAYVRTIV